MVVIGGSLLFFSYNRHNMHEQLVELEIECPVSRSQIQFKRFKISRLKPLEDLRQLLITVFDLEAFTARFKFYHKDLEIIRVKDIQGQENEYYFRILLDLQLNDLYKVTKKYCLEPIISNYRFELPLFQRRNIIMQRRKLQQIYNEEDEAQEAKEELQSNSKLPSDEEEGEDLSENAELDYLPIPELDRYEDEGVDNESHELNPEHRKAAEQQMKIREWRGGQDELEQLFQSDSEQREVRNIRLKFYEDEGDGQDEQMLDGIDPENQIGGPDEWFVLPSTRKYIKRHLIKFLTNYRLQGKPYYFQELKKMCINNHQSLLVHYDHLREFNIKLALWVIRYPKNVLPEYSAALYAVASKTYPAYSKLFLQCFFKVTGISILDKIRNLSYSVLGALIRVRGVVTSVSVPYNQLRKVFFKCWRCGYLKGPFFPNERSKIALGTCFSCHGSGPFQISSSHSVYRNHQIITVQQSPSQVQPGRIPRYKQAILTGDNIERVKPGDEIQIIGIFSTRYDCALNVKQGFPVFRTSIEVNSIIQTQKIGSSTQIDEDEFQKYVQRPDFPKCLYNSIAPSIYGHLSVKRALTLALFGGVQKKNTNQNHRVRGDLNVLLLGDPGIAKSQFLKSVQKVFPRCVYTTGKGASAVGLTACVLQDKVTHEWRLQAGALVLADKGVCLIDEFDKMSEQDRTSIHEAMEQQTISVSKAGIVATLNARCSVIAAANPSAGYYNEGQSFRDNTQLSEPILSRFDILCVVKDRPSEETDGKLASFVIGQHMKNHPYFNQYNMDDVYQSTCNKFTKQTGHTDAQFVKQFIKYAKRIQPKPSDRCSEIIKKVYTKMREFATTAGGINIVVRHLQSMIRIAQAHAKMHLRKDVNEYDAKVAVSTMLRSFIQTQRHSTAQRIKKAFKFDLLPEEFPKS